MEKKILLFLSVLFTFSVIACSKAPEVDEEELKQFVIEYDDALSKGWSESDEIFVPEVTKKYLSKDAFLDHCSNKYWYVYGNDIEIINIKKVPEEDSDLYGKNSYKITYRQKVIYEVRDNKILPFSNYDKTNIFVNLKNNKLYVTGYPYLCCCVKEKHLPALIKRKGLVYAE